MFLMRKKAAAVTAALALTGAVFAQDCKPSKWGPNDEIGASDEDILVLVMDSPL